MADTYNITFYFTNVTSVVEVVAKSEDEALTMARHREVGTPVPVGIPYNINKTHCGGKRLGAGNKRGRRRKSDPRDVKKTILWSIEEWQAVTDKAESLGINVATLQRTAVKEYIASHVPS